MSRVTLVALLWIGAGCAYGPRVVSLGPDVERPPAAAVLFLVDGLDLARFDEAIQEGRLPHIRSRFVEGGVGVDYAIASLPPITYPNLVSLLTGCFAGHHGIVGNAWFDRRRLVYQNYDSAATYRSVNGDFSRPTVYELMADRFTVSVQCPARRGVTHTTDHWFNTGRNWLFHQYDHTDRRVGAKAFDVLKLADRVARWPTLWLNYFPGLDAIAHESGPESDAYREGLDRVDRAIGQILHVVDAAGMTDRTYAVLLSDHGHLTVDRRKVFDAAGWLEGGGTDTPAATRGDGRADRSRPVRVFSGRTGGDYAERMDALNRYDVVMTNGAYRRLALHLRGARGWPYPPTADEVDRFLEQRPPLESAPAVELIARRAGEGCVRIDSRHGSALVQRDGGGSAARYRVVIERGDPLHFAGDGLPLTREPVSRVDLDRFAADGWHDAEAWLAATADGRYPDFVVQIVALFDSPRAGDILLFAADDWTFDARFRGGHGSCLGRDMRVPMFMAGPDVPRGGRIRHARLVDVMPTLLELLNEHHRLEDAGAIDGRSRATEFRGVGSADGRRVAFGDFAIW